MINAIARKYLTYFNKNRVYITSNAILLFGKQRNILFAACCFLCFLYIYKSLYITEQPCCLLQSHKCLLFHEMFVINVIDEIFFIRILEIHYFFRFFWTLHLGHWISKIKIKYKNEIQMKIKNAADRSYWLVT